MSFLTRRNGLSAKSLQQHRASFQQYNKARNLSPKTIRAYDFVLRQFQSWFMAEHSDNGEITTKRIREYLVHKRESGMVSSSLRTYYKILQAFFTFLVLDEVIEDDQNPMRRVKPPRVTPRQPEPLSDTQVRDFLQTFDKKSLTDFRDYVACVLILDSGLRVGEVSGAKLQDLDVPDFSLTVNGKGDKVRKIFFGNTTQALLRRYLETCRPWLRWNSPLLFPGDRRHPPVSNTSRHGQRLSQKVLLKMDKAGIPRANSSAHRLRHTFARNFIVNGGNVFALKEILGHATLEMTKKYVSLAEDDIRQAHSKASPVEALALD